MNANTSSVAPFGAISTFDLVSRVESIVQRVRRWNETRKTYAALSGLSQRELEDIGLGGVDLKNFAETLSAGR